MGTDTERYKPVEDTLFWEEAKVSLAKMSSAEKPINKGNRLPFPDFLRE